jgi:putative transcriptional regulator
MIVTINSILQQNNRSIYWLAKQLNCDYESLKRLINNESTSISFDLMQRICITLNCSPNDIFQIE